MKKDDLVQLEATMMKEVVRRRLLGGYSVEAEGVLVLSEALYRITQHLVETYPEQGNERIKNTSRHPRNGRGNPKGDHKLAE